MVWEVWRSVKVGMGRQVRSPACLPVLRVARTTCAESLPWGLVAIDGNQPGDFSL